MADHVLGKALLQQAAALASQQNAEHKKLVLAYPDLAARLCRPPLRYTEPRQWTGYIPPVRNPENTDGTAPLNTSPIRTALLALLEEAAERWDTDHGQKIAMPAPRPMPQPVLAAIGTGRQPNGANA